MKKNFNEFELENIVGGKKPAEEAPQVNTHFADPDTAETSLAEDEVPL